MKRKISADALFAMMQVLTGNRDIVELYSGRGVDPLDVMLAFDYAMRWVQLHSKGVEVTLPEKS